MRIWAFAAAAALIAGLGAVPAYALEARPAKRVCAQDDYACMAVSTRTAAASEMVTFTGTLSTKAMSSLRRWTKGSMDVCLTRYQSKPENDGSWPWETLTDTCTTVKRNGAFTLNANLGKPGLHYYGLVAGECKASRAYCGNADGMFIGVLNKGNRALALTTR